MENSNPHYSKNQWLQYRTALFEESFRYRHCMRLKPSGMPRSEMPDQILQFYTTVMESCIYTTNTILKWKYYSSNIHYNIPQVIFHKQYYICGTTCQFKYGIPPISDPKLKAITGNIEAITIPCCFCIFLH